MNEEYVDCSEKIIKAHSGFVGFMTRTHHNEKDAFKIEIVKGQDHHHLEISNQITSLKDRRSYCFSNLEKLKKRLFEEINKYFEVKK